MEPPTKRPRLGQQSKEDEDDELNYEPEEVSQMRDPGFRFEQSRAFAAFKLKSTFEHIFQKYEKDFTGIGDEIDLRTGKIITNNGHLASMRSERDTGILEDDEEEEEDEDEGVLLEEAFVSDDDEEDVTTDASDNQDDEERILHGKNDEESHSGVLIIKQKGELQRHPRLSTSSPSSNVWGHEPELVDPTWRVPEISKPKLGDDLITRLYGARYRFPASRGFKSVWSSRRDTEEEKALPEPAQIDMKQLIRARNEVPRMARPMSTKLLQAFTDQGDDNEDDILGVAVADKEPRAAKKTSDKTDVTLKEAVSTTVEENRQEAEPSTKMEPSHPKLNVTKVLSREIGWLNQNKTSVKEGSRPRKQLVPAKVIKPAEAPKETEATNPSQSTEEQAQQQSSKPPTEIDVEVEIDPSSTSFVTEHELRGRPKQRFVIELFSKIPSPEEITLVEDPEDVDIFESDHQHEALTPQLANLTVSETTSKSLVMEDSSEAATVKSTASVEAPTQKPAEPPKETFVRHKIDPSYDFSDDDEGIPTTRIGKLRTERETIAVPGTVEVATVIEAPSEPSERISISEDRQSSHTESNDAPSTASEALIEPSGINVKISEQQVEALPEVSEGQGITQVEEAGEGSTGTETNFTTLSAERLPEISQTEGHFPTETADMVGVKAASQNEVSVAQEPQTPTSSGQNQPTQVNQDVVEEAILEEAQEIQEQIHEEIQEETQEGNQEETQEDIQEQTSEVAQSDSEEPQQMKETQRETEEEVIEPFTIPLGLDEIDDTSAPEAESEAMEIELPILPPQLGASLLGPPLRRARHSSPTNPSEVVDKTATSPFKHMHLQSSSPLKKYSISKSPAKSSKASKSRASATSERKTKPRSRKPAASTLDRSESLTPPSAFSHSPHHTHNQKAVPSTPSSSRHQPRPAKDSTSRKSFISLLSDDEDELTLDLFKTRTTASGVGGGSSAERRRTSYTPVLLSGPHTKITTPMKQRSPLVPGSGNVGATSGTETTRSKKRKAAWAFATPTRVHFGSPSGSLVQTPGGNMRRCGENGFRCDRDFCLTCL
ncbi:hypothetical protein CSAL01_09305 [Colletotrichum salicis]|uniref:Centromere protein Scm3 n=1 Tax=Colletotrichum salicis TaxID=1209931 RepID=A0A135TRD0_9PEZI|nr:hypothetical protein CSAL01_09305 [Colletotrichum salicis]